MRSLSLRPHRGLLLFLCLGCSPDDGGRAISDSEYVRDRPDGTHLTRRITVREWTETTLVGRDEHDTTLITPARLTASKNGLYLLDHVAGRVQRFGHDGQLHWSFGRVGIGPNEFADLRDLKVDAEGRAWVLDPMNSRVLVLDRDGTPERRIPLATLGNSPRELVLLGDSGVLLVTDSPGRDPLVEMDSLGQQRRRLPFPWAGFKKLDYLATQVVTGANAETGAWVMAFRLGDGFFAARGGAETRRGWFVEHVAFPEVQREQRGAKTSVWRHRHRPTDAAVSVTLSPSRVYVLFGGTTGERYRLLDSYSLQTGEYLNSYVLPRAVSEVSWYNGGFYGLSDDPYPAIRYFRPVGSAAP